MGLVRQQEQGGQETVAGVVTQGSLGPVLEVKLAAKRVHVNKLRLYNRRSLAGDEGE